MFFLFSCKKNPKGKTPIQENNESSTHYSKPKEKVYFGDSGIIENIKDTLEYFKATPSFFIKYFDITYKLKGFTVNNEKFAVSIILGQQLVVFKLNGEIWEKIYGEEMEMNPQTIVIKNIDLNFDGYKDILIEDEQGAWGNKFSTTFIYDKTRAMLQRTPYLDLRNISFDFKNKLVQSHSYRGACWVVDKNQYKFNKDTIEQVSRVEFVPPVNCHTDYDPVIKIFLYENGLVKDSTIKRTEKAFSLYLKALWDISKDYH